MKVLHLNNHLFPKGGVETYLLSLFPILKEHGIQPIWGFAEGDPNLWPEHVKCPLLGQISPNKHKGELQKALDRLQPDIIHIHNVQNSQVIEIALANAPTVLTTHDYRWNCPANTFFFKRTQNVCPKSHGDLGCFAQTLSKHCLTPRPKYAIPFYQRVKRMNKLSSQIKTIIAPSAGAAQRLINAGWSSEQIEILPYFCPIPPLPQPRQLPERKTITYIGRIAPNKGQEYFIEALGLLPNEIKGTLVGNLDAGKEAELLKLAYKFNCADRLSLRPWANREDIIKTIDQTTVFVFPSLWEETLGIVGIEALSRGVPVVASDLGGVPQWLKHEKNGYLVPPKSAKAIKDAVLKLTNSKERLLEAGQAGIETILQGFLPEQHIQNLIRIYQHAVKN